MAKVKQSPGTALTALLEKHQLNYNRLAKAIGLSSAMVRLIARDENPVSASVAFRLARFFKTSPSYWLSLQVDFDIATAAQDKKLAKSLKEMPTVDTATFERKPKASKRPEGAKRPKPVKKAKAAKGRKPPKAAAPKKAATAKAAAKKAPVAKKAPAVKKAAVKKAAPKAAAPQKPPAKPAKPAKAPVVKKAAPVKPAAPAKPVAPAKPPVKADAAAKKEKAAVKPHVVKETPAPQKPEHPQHVTEAKPEPAVHHEPHHHEIHHETHPAAQETPPVSTDMPINEPQV